ncbi:mannose-6-phosphate isomerase, class I [uncultured Thiohalocapsa sp.]|uniref:mannose-6-phosphate isomerase, class I n=1 Tax=uncultured Thiohalocapsa sp. TaxID=768990 RepID=UPI0025E5B437|nr:mannose-6-phosphate isomerase, class I [uncultured Thiohalocapsa sp.]
MAAANGGGSRADQRLAADAIAAYARKPHPVALCCGVHHYGWGDRRFIPQLLGAESPAVEPQAELWIGAHPDLPATACLHPARVPLDVLVAALPEAVLGAAMVARFGATLPFLFKVLAAATPLSIQAHPNRTQAANGCLREDRLGLALNDPGRSYRDRNHKPELLVALTDFHALRGFRPLEAIAAELVRWPSLADLGRRFDASTHGLRTLYAEFMRLPQAAVDARLAPLVTAAQRRCSDPKDTSRERCRWLLAAHRRYSPRGHYDRGLLSFLLLNLLHLRPGQAIFLPAGELHSYLQGAGLELMANSNNVLRGGLSAKHIDVDALLEVLRVDPHVPRIMAPQTAAHDPRWQIYAPPVAEFSLRRLRLGVGDAAPLEPHAVMLGLVLDGTLHIDGAASRLRLHRGGTCLLPAGAQLQITSRGGADLALATTAACG